MAHIAESLAVNSGLEMLLLAANPFGDEGGKQLAAVLCNNNRSLRVLDVHGTRMSKQGEKEVRRVLKTIQSQRERGAIVQG